VYYISYSHPDLQTPSYHSVATPLIMIFTMRGNVPHSKKTSSQSWLETLRPARCEQMST